MKKVWVWYSLLLLALCPAATSAETLSVSISSPKAGAQVAQKQEAAGKVSYPYADVYVVIHQVATSDFWVQPSVTVSANGSWKGQVQFGEAGRPAGKKYEVRAFADPVDPITEGKCSQWPKAKASTKAVEVIGK